MTQLEDRLRAALRDTPLLPAETLDPLADLERRTDRARLRWASAGVAAIAVVIAAIVVPLSLTGGGHRPAPRKFVPAAPTLWADHRVMSETVSADGSVWTLSSSRLNNPTYYVERHEPSAGEVVAKYPVPDWAEFISAAGGQIWVWGGGDGGYPDGYLEAIDQTTGHHVIRNLGKGQAILPDVYAGHPVAPIAGGLLAVLEDRKTVVEIGLSNQDQISLRRRSAVAGATQLFADGQLVYVSSPTRWLKTINLGSTPATHRTSLSGPPLAVYPHAPDNWQGLLVNQQSKVVGEQDDSDYFSSGLKAPASNGAATIPVFAAVDPAGGLYVGWADDPDHAAQVVTYYTAKNLSTPVIVRHDPSYSTATFQSPGPPNATIKAAAMSDFALDPAGGLVYLQGDPANPAGYATVARWNPAGS